jgi:hypothetical protein
MMKGITIEVSNKIENNKLERISNKKKSNNSSSQLCRSKKLPMEKSLKLYFIFIHNYYNQF